MRNENKLTLSSYCRVVKCFHKPEHRSTREPIESYIKIFKVYLH